MMKVLLDGWSLLFHPDSPQTLHLMTLIEQCPSGVSYTVAVPGTPPVWLSQDVDVYETPTGGNAWGQLNWEQRILPRIAVETAADLLHLMTPTPALFSSVPTVLSPSVHPTAAREGGLGHRLRDALAAGGMSRIKALMWPDDLPSPNQAGTAIYSLPPVVLPQFFDCGEPAEGMSEAMDLPETFIIYHGPVDVRSIQRLTEVWSWAAGPIGEYYPLLIVGLTTDPSQENLGELLLKSGTASGMYALPVLNPVLLATVYHRSTAVLHLDGIPPWGNSARNALACGKPLVAAADTEIDAVVGPAAYLAAEEDRRSLGAALITVVVEDSLAGQLSQAARQRSSAWDSARFKEGIKEAYGDILSR